jgi:folate-binding protein YgfZ
MEHEKLSAILLPWAARLVLRGDDAFSFLQGQWSQDLREVREDHAACGLWLDRKGRVQGEAWIRRLPAAGGAFAYEILSSGIPLADLTARLEAFIIADDVTLEPAPEAAHACVWLSDDAATGVSRVLGLGALPVADGAVLGAAGLWVLRARTPWGKPGYAIWNSDGGDERLQACVSGAGELLPKSEVERMRIEAGIPRIPVDCGPSDLPGEAGLEAGRVSYNKGCFIGQEVLARLRAQGRLRRGLVRVRGAGAMPLGPVALMVGERKIGEVRSTVQVGDGWVGLGLAVLADLPERAVLAGAGTVTVELV